MKLNDIDQTLNEAPVGMMKRAATKLKKHTPFAPGKRAEAEGEEITQKAANELALAFRKWAGTRKGDPDFNMKALTVEDLMDFFTDEGFAKTAQEVIQAAAQQKQAKKKAQGEEQPEEDPEDVAKGETSLNKPEGMSDDEFADVKKRYGFESYEVRLAELLNEDNADPVTFDVKEVEKLILTIVSRVDKENHEGLAARVANMSKSSGGDAGSTSSGQSSDKVSVTSDDLKEIKRRLDLLGEDIKDVIRKQKGVDDDIKKEIVDKIDNLVYELAKKTF